MPCISGFKPNIHDCFDLDARGITSMSTGTRVCQVGRILEAGKKKNRLKPIIKGFITFIALMLLVALFLEDDPYIQVYPELRGYWVVNYNWNIEATIDLPDEAIPINSQQEIAADLSISKGPPEYLRGFEGKVIVANHFPERIYVESIKVAVVDKRSSNVESEKTIAAGEYIEPEDRKAIFVKTGDLQGKDRYSAKISTYVRSRNSNRRIDSLVDIQNPEAPIVTNKKITLVGPGITATKGLIAEYKPYSRTFTRSTRDRQIFKFKALYAEDFFVGFNYVVMETGQAITLNKKFSSR